MSKVRNPRVRRKRHHSERFRGPNLLVERWSNAKSAHLGFHLGAGKTYAETCRIVGDGTSPETLRSIVRKWYLPIERQKGRAGMLVFISTNHSRKLDEQAAKLGISKQEFARRILEEAIQSVLYNAITDNKWNDRL